MGSGVGQRRHPVAVGRFFPVCLTSCGTSDMIRTVKTPLRILGSSLKHGVTEDVIRRVVRSPMYIFELRQDPPKIALLGMGEGMRPVEVVYVINDDGTHVVIHAMPATKAFLNRVRRDRKESR